MIKNYINALLGACLLAPAMAQAQAPSISWQKNLGGSQTDLFTATKRTADGGMICGGYTSSASGDITGAHGADDWWVVKLDAAGNVKWSKVYGGTSADQMMNIIQTKDGGYIAVGASTSADGDLLNNYGSEDAWILRLDSLGNKLWSKEYGGTQMDHFNSVVENADNTITLVGVSYSADHDLAGGIAKGYGDVWVLKLSSAGDYIWQQCHGGGAHEEGMDIAIDKNGGYLVTGECTFKDGGVTNYNGGAGDAWVLKLDDAGNTIWSHAFGGSNIDAGWRIRQTSDGSVMVAGITNSTDSGLTANHGANDFWLMKLSSSGALQWQKLYGGTSSEQLLDMDLTTDGGVLMTGFTMSNNTGDVGVSHGSPDGWVVKIDAAGTLQWSKTLGGSGDDELWGGCQNADGSYSIAGMAISADGDLTGNKGYGDAWALRLTPVISVKQVNSTNHNFRLYPNPVNAKLNIITTAGNAQLQVMDMTGKILLQQTVHNNSVADMTVFSAGVYMYNVVADGVVIAQGKLIKQ